MASHNTRYYSKMREIFPLKVLDDYVKLFHHELNSLNGPNLSVLSIVIGLIENHLTSVKIRSSTVTSTTQLAAPANATTSSMTTVGSLNTSSTTSFPSATTIINRNLINLSPNQLDENSFDSVDDLLDDDDYETLPIIQWNQVHNLYLKFKAQIKGSVDLSQYKKKTSRELIKKISDVIWSNLTRSYYKDKAHLQTLYSYLTGNKLDCFGVAYAVIAACQVLDIKDVRLALSEDHAWVIFGEKGEEETAEITWHGKGNEDKRGQPVNSCNSWLYLNGYPVVCDLQMTVAALVSSINCSINAYSDSEQLLLLQQRLLWLLYNEKHLVNYPMAIGNLGDLEEYNPTPCANKLPSDFYKEAIEVNKRVYSNYHVFPYTYLAGYQFRNGCFKDALKTWSNAASVIRQYNYTRDDEEIYKEFLEIANELIPHIVKIVSAGGYEPARKSTIPIFQDAQCFAYLLRFYDGLCGWEEDSSTPVLHIGWAKPFVATISKFSYNIRNKVKIELYTDDENDNNKANSYGDNYDRRHKDSKITTDEKLKEKDEEHLRIVDTPPPSLKRPDEIDDTDEGIITEDDEHETHKKIIDCTSMLDEKTKLNEKDSYIDNNKKPNNELNLMPIEQTKLTENYIDKTKLKDEIYEKDENETVVYLQSQKMIGLKELLLAEKLNTSALQLQLTAQSQVHLTKRSRVGSFGTYSHSELDFVATTTATLGTGTAASQNNSTLNSLPSNTVGQRVSKRIRRD